MTGLSVGTGRSRERDARPLKRSAQRSGSADVGPEGELALVPLPVHRREHRPRQGARQQVAISWANPASFLLLLIGLLIAVLVAVLVAQWIIGLGCLSSRSASPDRHGFARHTGDRRRGEAAVRTILGTVSTVVMQAVGLSTTPTILLNPNNSNLPLLGKPGDPRRVACRCLPGNCFSGLRCGRSASRSRYATRWCRGCRAVRRGRSHAPVRRWRGPGR
ncbi:MAG: hypothetical protein QOG10_4573 [Kribbellaceae bacterium]|nr:hypothetical protein [Kribbellaceae bacterium]